MAAHRKPTELLLLKGAYAENPSRFAARANEPAPTEDIGWPPDHLSPEACALWMELASTAHAGTLSRADRIFMEYAVATILAMRAMAREGEFDSKVATRTEAVLARLGMTPSDRSRVSVMKRDEPADPTAEFG